MTGRVLVAPEALSGLVNRLRGVQEALDDDVRPTVGDLGQPELVDALEDFLRNWGKKRRALSEDLGEATICVVTTRDRFVEVDCQLASSLVSSA